MRDVDPVLRILCADDDRDTADSLVILLEKQWRQIDTPALLLWGRHDHVVPLWVGERLSRELPRAELVVIERCGHIPPEERPEETLAHLRSVLTRVER